MLGSGFWSTDLTLLIGGLDGRDRFCREFADRPGSPAGVTQVSHNLPFPIMSMITPKQFEI